MTLSPLQRRAERKARNHQGLNMNLVALIDIFTILLFFLLSSATEMETLAIPRAVDLPKSLIDATPKPSLVVLVNAREIVVDGRTVARTPDVLSAGDAANPALQAALVTARAKFKQAGAAKGQPDTDPGVTIMGDKDIPYRLLRTVMSHCAQAEFSDVSFAVRTRLEKAGAT
ncbi:MAG: biopolymer transporter ExbD [Rubrivivax sp.]|nr:biopolymer transporter ExbD [Rubrivivax sp.]